MKSMTGFGRSAATSSDGQITFAVEISSINRKQLEIRINLPRELSICEPMVRSLVAAKTSRGSLTVRVTLDGENSSLSIPRLNRAALKSLLAQCHEFQQESGIGGTLELSDLIAIPGVVESSALDTDQPWLEELLQCAVGEAIDNLLAMRETEGQAIRGDFQARLRLLEDLLNQIEPLAAELPEAMRLKMLERLRNAGLEVDCDDERLIKELVIFSDKYDVAEEIIRLRSHFVQFRKFIDCDQTQVGRSMDFLVQEVYREINTLGNKAGGSQVSPLVVAFKSELERIREQVQNIE